VVPWNQHSCKIPIDIEPAKRRAFREIVLYYSVDEGKTWHQSEKVQPDAECFKFRTAQDGLYWFQVAGVNLQGKEEPALIHQIPPKMKMLIDTRKPDLRIAARRDGQELVVAWEAMDANPDPKSLTLEYQVLEGTAAPWLPVTLPMPPPARGEARTRLTSPATVVVRMQVKDLVGNTTVAEDKVVGTDNIQAGFSQKAQPPNAGGLQLPGPAGGQATKPPAVDTLPTPPGGNAQSRTQDAIPALPVKPPPASGSNAAPVPGAGSYLAKAVPNRAPEPVGAANPNLAPTAPARRPLPPVQLVNDRWIVVEYQLSRVGPSGIGSVELYLTQDDGQKWLKFAVDEDAKSGTAGAKYQRSLELPAGDGVYGLYLVVRNGAGRGKAPPRSGDAPEMRIEVDTTSPQAQLQLPPVPDPERRDALLLTWQAKDKNLGTGPISLDWAEQRDGPWHPIAANVPNTERYSWQVPTGVPVEVFLRLKVRDNAGNEAVAVTDRPEIVDLTEPEGKISTVRSANRVQE